LISRKTTRSQALAHQGPTEGEEEQTNRHTVKAHVEKDQTGSRLMSMEEGGSVEKRGEREWWECDKRERNKTQEGGTGERVRTLYFLYIESVFGQKRFADHGGAK